jgi:hypothetical protein
MGLELNLHKAIWSQSRNKYVNISSMGAFLIKCTKDYVECSKILFLPNFEKLLHEF